jgi:hypothetical protein
MLRKCAWVVFVLLSVSGLAAAESKARIVRLSFIEGDVEMDRGDGHGFIRAFVNMPVIEGTKLWPKADGRAEVEFEDGSTLRLVPDTILAFDELRLGDRGDKITRLVVQQGIVYANVKDHDHDQFNVDLAQQDLHLKHSSRFRVEVYAQEMKVAVFRGELELLRNTGQKIEVKKNETLALDVADPERYYLSKGITEGPHDYWDREREEQIVIAESRRAAPRSVVVYGYDDLSPYGTWVEVGGYGRLWRPFGISVGWHPYAYGGWVWYPSYGYVWVSSHPWGWTPYRYGGWHYVNAYGWCWRPGPRINITNINIYHAPPHYVAPRPPVVTQGHPFAIAYANDRPVDPRSRWMNQPQVSTTTRVDRRTLNGERGFSPRLEAKGIDQSGDRPSGTSTPRIVGTAVNDRDVSNRTTVDRSGRVRTVDRDYNNVDYRRSTPREPVVRSSGTASEAAVQRDPIGRVPVYKRDVIDRDGSDRPARTAEIQRAPSSDAAPQVSRPTAERRESPQPRIDRSGPQVDRPAPRPEPRSETRVQNAPRPSAPPPSIQRSSPPHSPSPGRSAPLPRINNAEGKGVVRER